MSSDTSILTYFFGPFADWELYRSFCLVESTGKLTPEHFPENERVVRAEVDGKPVVGIKGQAERFEVFTIFLIPRVVYPTIFYGLTKNHRGEDVDEYTEVERNKFIDNYPAVMAYSYDLKVDLSEKLKHFIREYAGSITSITKVQKLFGNTFIKEGPSAYFQLEEVTDPKDKDFERVPNGTSFRGVIGNKPLLYIKVKGCVYLVEWVKGNTIRYGKVQHYGIGDARWESTVDEFYSKPWARKEP